MKLRFDLNTLDVERACGAFIKLYDAGVKDIQLVHNTWNQSHFNIYGDIEHDLVDFLQEVCPKQYFNEDVSEL